MEQYSLYNRIKWETEAKINKMKERYPSYYEHIITELNSTTTVDDLTFRVATTLASEMDVELSYCELTDLFYSIEQMDDTDTSDDEEYEHRKINDLL